MKSSRSATTTLSCATERLLIPPPSTKRPPPRKSLKRCWGAALGKTSPKEKTSIGEKMFEVDHLSGADGKVDDVSLYVRSSRIVGVAGLVGAGKSELCKTIFGGYRRSGGSIRLNGRRLNIRIPTHAVKNRIALVPEERRKEGVLVTENVNFNLSAANLSEYCQSLLHPQVEGQRQCQKVCSGAGHHDAFHLADRQKSVRKPISRRCL